MTPEMSGLCTSDLLSQGQTLGTWRPALMLCHPLTLVSRGGERNYLWASCLEGLRLGGQPLD